MIPKPDAAAIAIVGNWNTHIFSPAWVGEEIYEKKGIELEFKVVPGVKLIDYKSPEDSLSLLVSENRLDFKVGEITEEALTRAESVATRTLGLLPHTPVAAFGVNFNYEESEPTELLTGVFDFADQPRLAEGHYSIKSAELRRGIEWEEFILNVRLAFDNGKCDISLNFHRDVSSASAALDELDGKVVTLFRKGLSFLQDLYGCELEESDGD